jgi:hypothetical protein
VVVRSLVDAAVCGWQLVRRACASTLGSDQLRVQRADGAGSSLHAARPSAMAGECRTGEVSVLVLVGRQRRGAGRGDARSAGRAPGRPDDAATPPTRCPDVDDGPLALAVTAVGAMAVGRLAIADAVIRRPRAVEIVIGWLKVRELEVSGQRWTGSSIPSSPTADRQS